MPVEIKELIIKAKSGNQDLHDIKIEGESFIMSQEDIAELKSQIREEILSELEQLIRVEVQNRVRQIMEYKKLR